MMQLHDPLSYENAATMQDICRPFFTEAGLNYFDYVRLYDDNTFFALASDRSWTKHFITRQFPIVSDTLQPGKYLWNIGDDCAYFAQDARNFYNHDHGITIIRRFDDCCESFSFAAPHENSNAINFYLNNMDKLENFVWHFKEQTKHIAKTENTKKQRAPAPFYQAAQNLITNKQCSATINNDELKIFSYILNPGIQNLHLTKREMECYISLLKGRTAAETAAALNLSSKTIEGYINTIKQKLSCQNKSQLFDMAVELGLIPLIS